HMKDVFDPHILRAQIGEKRVIVRLATRIDAVCALRDFLKTITGNDSNDSMTRVLQALDNALAQSARVDEHQPLCRNISETWREFFEHGPIPGGHVEPVRHVGFLPHHLRTTRPTLAWIDPKTLPFEGVGRNRDAMPSFVTIESFPVDLHSRLPQPAKTVQQE